MERGPDRTATTVDFSGNGGLRINRIVAFTGRTSAYPNTSLNCAQGSAEFLGYRTQADCSMCVSVCNGLAQLRGQRRLRWPSYPLKTFSALDAGGEIHILATLELFERTGKVSVEITSEAPVKLYKITICKWETYQSEYLRQKSYQKTYREKNKNLSPDLSGKKRSVYPQKEK
jgi:hypothetical protein